MIFNFVFTWLLMLISLFLYSFISMSLVTVDVYCWISICSVNSVTGFHVVSSIGLHARCRCCVHVKWLIKLQHWRVTLVYVVYCWCWLCVFVANGFTMSSVNASGTSDESAVPSNFVTYPVQSTSSAVMEPGFDNSASNYMLHGS